MKNSTKNQVRGKFHKAKGKVEEIAGKVSMNPELKSKGEDEKRFGKLLITFGEIQETAGK